MVYDTTFSAVVQAAGASFPVLSSGGKFSAGHSCKMLDIRPEEAYILHGIFPGGGKGPPPRMRIGTMIDIIKDAFRKERLLANIHFFIMLNAGLLLTALGIVWFKTPNNFAFGGTSGLSVLLAALFPQFNVGFFMWLLNLALVALGFIFLGISCMGWTVFSSIALSFYVSLCEAVWPMDAPFTDDKLLELIFAVLLPAVGSAIVFNIGASTGGTDIVAMILTKHSSLNIGTALMVSDVAIVCGALLIFGMATGLYSFLGLIGKSFVVDGVIESINQRKVCTVVTTNPEDVTEYILEELHRSATIEEAQGAYTGKDLTVVMTVLTRREATLLRNFLRMNDNHAFITIVNSSEIIGKGFRAV